MHLDVSHWIKGFFVNLFQLLTLQSCVSLSVLSSPWDAGFHWESQMGCLGEGERYSLSPVKAAPDMATLV